MKRAELTRLQSPSGVPGAWTWDFDEVDVGSAPRGREASGALLLPPPFLDESSSRESFEGLFSALYPFRASTHDLQVS